MISILLALANAFAGSLGNILGALATRRAPTSLVLIVTSLSSLLVAVAIASLLGGATSPPNLFLGFCAGVIGAVGVPLCYRAFAIGPVGMVSPVLSCTATMTVVAGAWISSGAIESAAVVGFVLCIIAVLVATVERKRVTARAALLALSAGLSFGLFSLVIAQIPGNDGLWPLAAARVGVVIFAVILLAGVRATTRAAHSHDTIARAWIPLAALSGVIEILANILFLAAVSYGDLATVSVVQALSPVAAILVGWALLRSRPRTRHWIAVVIAIAALVVVARG